MNRKAQDRQLQRESRASGLEAQVTRSVLPNGADGGRVVLTRASGVPIQSMIDAAREALRNQ